MNWLVNESKIRTGYEKPIYFISDENELWNVAYQMLKSTSFERLIQQINNSKRSCLDTWHDQGDDGPLYRGIFIQKIREADLNILINALDENSFLSIANLKFPVLMTVHYDNLFCLRWITGTMKYDDSKYIFDFKWCSEEPSFICEEKNVETELPEWCNAMMIEWLPSPNLFHEKYQNFMYTNCLCQLTGIDGVKLECDWPGIKNLELDVNTKWVDQNIGHPLLKEDYAFLSFPLPNTLTSRQIFIRLDPLYFHFILQSILLVPLINIISEYLFELPNPTCH